MLLAIGWRIFSGFKNIEKENAGVCVGVGGSTGTGPKVPVFCIS